MVDNTRTQLIDMKRQLTPSDLLESELKAAFTKRPAEVKKFKGRMARLKGMLTQWEPFRIQIENYIAKKTKESKDLPDKIARLKKVVKDECAHPVEFLNVSSEYNEDENYTEHFVECSLCKKKEMVKKEVHNTYG